MPEQGRIVVAVDDSDAGKRAFWAALSLAKKLGSQLLVVSVIEDLVRTAGETVGEVDESYEHSRDHFEWLQRPMLERAGQEQVAATGHVLVGNVVERLVEFVREQAADLVVIGSLGRTHLLGLGGVKGYHIAEHAPCAVLIAK